MKKLLTLGLATVVTTQLFAGETLNLKLVPERDLLVKNRPQEVVIKIDLSAISDRTRSHRTPLNLAVVLDRSGSMAGAKIDQARKALKYCVDTLNPQDRFDVVRFSTEAEPLFNGLKEANDDNRKKASEFAAGLRAAGGTAIDDATRHRYFAGHGFAAIRVDMRGSCGTPTGKNRRT